jgi:archaellum component FlaC
MKVFYKCLAVLLLVVLGMGVAAYVVGTENSALSSTPDVVPNDKVCCEYQSLHEQLEVELAKNEESLSLVNSQIAVLLKMVGTFLGNDNDSIAMLNEVLAEIESLQNQVRSLQGQVTALTNNNKAKDEEITILLQQVIEQIESIKQLNNQVANLKQLLTAWENSQKFVVVFMIEGLAFNTQIIDPNTFAVDPGEPVRGIEWRFDGWSIDGVNMVDVSTYVINGDVTFVSMWTLITYTVTFVSSQTGHASVTRTVVRGQFATPPGGWTSVDLSFIGWDMNPATTPIMSDKTFTAQWRVRAWTTVYTITWANSIKHTGTFTLNFATLGITEAEPRAIAGATRITLSTSATVSNTVIAPHMAIPAPTNPSFSVGGVTHQVLRSGNNLDFRRTGGGTTQVGITRIEFFI